MALKKIRLGDYLIPFKEKCGISNLTPYEISGVNKNKEFFEPSRQTGEDTTNYQNVPPCYFACNLMHVGRDCVLPIAYNHTNTVKHVSPAYSIFRIKDNPDLLEYYFFIYLKSNERDRYFWFNTDGSVRDGMSWEDLCNVELEVPSRQIQQKYVDVYNAMLENQKSYEKGLDDLKLVCDAYIEDLRRKTPCEEIKNYTSLKINCKNKELKCLNVRGVKVTKELDDTKAEIDENSSLSNYKLVEPREIVYVPNTARMGDKFACALSNEFCCVSPIYEIIQIDVKKLMPEYLFMWFNRLEFDRYARYNSWGSVRESIDWETLGCFSIPIPKFDIQQSVVDIFKCYLKRKEINEKLKKQIKDICPILIKGSIEEAKKEAIRG